VFVLSAEAKYWCELRLN